MTIHKCNRCHRQLMQDALKRLSYRDGLEYPAMTIRYKWVFDLCDICIETLKVDWKEKPSND
jgi:hypothetical protein